MSVKANYQPALPKIEPFLCSVGRRKFLDHLHQIHRNARGSRQGCSTIYTTKARPAYHPIAQATIDTIVV